MSAWADLEQNSDGRPVCKRQRACPGETFLNKVGHRQEPVVVYTKPGSSPVDNQAPKPLALLKSTEGSQWG